MDLDKGGNAADWFLMAAIDHHLGNDSDARRWYERAISWLKQAQPTRKHRRPRAPPVARGSDQGPGTGGLDSDDGTTGFVIEAMNEAGQHVEPRGDLSPVRDPKSGQAMKEPRPPPGRVHRNPTQRSSPTREAAL